MIRKSGYGFPKIMPDKNGAPTPDKQVRGKQQLL
jgi:hypothetical protein